MKTYISDLIPKISRFSQKLDDLTWIKNQNWVMVNDISLMKVTYIFRDNGVLLISENGIIKRAKWEYLNSDSIILDIDAKSLLVQQAFKSAEVLVLNLDGSNQYSFFINESKYNGTINSFPDLEAYLQLKYLKETYGDANRKFYYMEFYKEHGPFTAEQIVMKLNKNLINPSCLVRAAEDLNYNSEMRIRDLNEIMKML